MVIAVLPLVMMTISVMQEASLVYARFRSGDLNLAAYFAQLVHSLPAWLQQLLERFDVLDIAAAQQRILASLGQNGHAITSQAFSIGQTTFDFVVSLFLMVYLLFFLLRDGPALSARIVDAIPLPEQHKTELFAKFVTVVRATVKGNILVALVQGALGGVAIGFLSVRGAVLWRAVMAVLSLLPAIGAAIV